MFLLLLLSPLTSAEFLTPVNEDVDNSTLPEFCFEENVISCILVRPDPAALLSSSLELADVVLEYPDVKFKGVPTGKKWVANAARVNPIGDESEK